MIYGKTLHVSDGLARRSPLRPRARVLDEGPRKAADQVALAQPATSQGGGAVGWLALYPNCCTSYPIPLKLMVLSNGRVRTFTGNGLPVWRWAFQNDDTRVAFEQETVH